MNRRAHCIIFNNEKGYLILLKNKLKKGIYHQILSGGVENDERFDEAIVREIKEEINLDISKDRIKYLLKENNRAFFYLDINNLEVNNLRLSNEHIGYGFVKDINFIPHLTINQSKGEVSQILNYIIDAKII